MADKVRALPPGYTFIDNSGNALASGTINTYIEGTTTNKATYTDQAGGTTNANPVVLDSNGRANIWLDVDQGYKFLVKDSAGSTIVTVDNIFGIPNDEYQIADAKGIYDENGNEQLIFQTTASAVNYLQATNSITAVGPTLEATGSDTNVDLQLQAKGTGVVTVLGTATASAEVRLREDTDNGTNYIGLKAPASVTANRTITLSDEDLTLSVATQAQMETATSNLAFVTPGRTQYHPGVAKAILYSVLSAGSPAASLVHNVASIDDDGVGNFGVNFTTAFSTGNFAAVCSGSSTGAADGTYIATPDLYGTTSVEITCEAQGDSSLANVVADPLYFQVVCFGDQ